MTRSIHRRSILTRVFCVYVVLVVLASFAGLGYAAPNSGESPSMMSDESTASPPPAEEPVAEEPPAEEPVAEEPIDVADEPAEASPPSVADVAVSEDRLLESDPFDAPQPQATDMEPVAVIPADIGSGDVNLEGVRKGTGWIKGNLQPYQEGEWVPFRLWVRNSDDVPVTVPALTVDAFHYKDGKGIYFDRTGDYYYYITDTEPAIGDPISPQGGWTPLSLDSHDVAQGGTYGVDATGLLTTISDGQVEIPPGEYAVLYFRAHLALTVYWNLQDPPRDGWGPYTGSPGNMQVDGLGAKTVPLPAVEAPEGAIDVIKFYDDDHDGVMDPGEEPLPDWTIHLQDTGGGVYSWDATLVTDAQGHALFSPLPQGTFQIYEDLKTGWSTSTTQPVYVTIDGDETETVYIGNYLPDVTKSFSLTYNGTIPDDTSFYVSFLLDGAPTTLALSGAGPLTASADYPVGSVISNVEWYALWEPTGYSVDILLGTSSGETLTEEVTNEFAYGGSLDGYKYEDLDADGIHDPGEPALAGWEIVLERQVGADWVVYDQTVTDVNGYYLFDNVLPGSYRVSEVLKVDFEWEQSYPADYHMLSFAQSMVEAEPPTYGTQHEDKDFLNWAPASIEGVKFEDLDADGVKDVGEPGLEDWIIYVDYDGDNMLDAGEPSDATDANGEYLITGVTPGTYSVREVLPGEWFQTLGTYVVGFESRGHYGGEGEYDFGNWTYANKSGVKFHDLDADGVKDPGEPGLEGWTIFVDYDDDGVHDPGEPGDITNATGYYSIGGIQPGLFKVREVQQVGWTQSYPGSGYHEVDFTSGLDDQGNDFGNWTTASIQGMKFNDLDGDGTQDAGDDGLEGWIVFVDYDGDGMVDPTEPWDETDANGDYLIEGVVPGSYWVREVLQTDWTQSRGDFLVEFESGGEYGLEGEYDFGNWTTASIDGYKFLDKDAEGDWDAGEPGLEGWTIYLMGTTVEGPVLMSTLTAANGYYSFGDLPPGDYIVSEELPADWFQSYPETGTWELTLGSGGSPETSLDFGNWQPLDPWGYKFHDLDADGVWDVNEPGLEGWEIHLDGTAGTGDPVHLVTYSDATGHWQFTGVPPGDYVISEVDGGWIQSFPPAPGTYDVTLSSLEVQEVGFDFGNWTTASKYGVKFEDLDADGVKDPGEPPLSNWMIYADYDDDGAHDAGEPFALTDATGFYELDGIDPGTWAIREVMKVDFDWVQSMPGAPDYAYVETFASDSEFRENDFGNWAPASITGVKFEDLDADGVFENGEPTLEGWRIFVDYDGDDMYDVGEPTDLTDANGIYEITGITPGTYDVREVLETDWNQTRGNFSVEFVSRGEYGVEGEYDFGNWHAAEKAGTKFEDLDADGVKDPGEPGLSGWTIFVDYDGDGIHDAGEPFDVTDVNGEYLITDITPGTYLVREIMKVDFDWVQSMPGAPDYAYEETFDSSDSFVDNDFGNWAPASITGVKFEDLDADGVRDPVDPGLSGWTIFVDYDDDGVPDAGEPSDVTGPDGVYEITGVTPGTYMVLEVMQTDWTQSRGGFEVTFYSRGEYGLEGEYDFGNWMTASLSGAKFHDLDGDGVWDDGEPGLEGWEIQITGISGEAAGVEATTSTDANGDYGFDGLTPGEYEISEVMQNGWTQSYPEGNTHTVLLESGDQPEETFDFGNWTTTGLSGHKFHDLDADGVWDQPDEEPLIGWLIEITGTTGAGVPYDDVAITDIMGYYEFTDLPPGAYVVSEVQQPFWTQTAPEGDTYDRTLVSGGVPEEDLDFGNSEEAEKLFELTYVGPVPEDTTMTVTFESFGPILVDAGIALDTFGPHTIELVPQGDGTYTGSFDVVPGVVITNVEWWAVYRGEPIKLGDGLAEETINGPVLNEFEYDASAFGSKWDDTDLLTPEVTLGQGDGVWDAGEPALPDWTIELYRMGEEGWELYDTQVTDAAGAYEFEGLLPGEYYLAEVIPLDPVTELPMWNQSAGPSGEGDEQFVVADGSAVGPVDFGNWTPFAPFTVDIGIAKTVSPTQAKPGDTLTYSLTYTMVVGGIVDEPLTIVDDYDEDLIDIVDANGGVVSDGTITWTFNETLAFGESDTISYTAKVKSGVADATRIDNVVVIDMAGDTNPANNRDDASVVVDVSEPFLPFTGGQALPLLLAALWAVIVGLALRRARRATV